MILVLDGGGQPGNRVRGKEEAGLPIHIGWGDGQFLALHRRGVEDAPNRPAAGAGAAIQAHGGRKVAHGIPLVIGRVAPIVLLVIWAGLEGSGGVAERALRLVIKPHTDLVDADHVLIIPDLQADGADQVEILAARLPLGSNGGVSVLAPDIPWLRDMGAEFRGLVGGAPKRCPHLHGGDFSAGILAGIGLARVAAVFLGEARIEYAAELHVAGRAACGDDDASPAADIELGAAFDLHRDSGHPARVVILPDNAGHPVVQKDLHARFPRGCLQRAHDADAPGSGFPDFEGHGYAGLNPRVFQDGRVHGPGSRLARLGHAPTVGFRFRPFKSMGHQKVVGENVVVGESANEVAVVEAVLGGPVAPHRGPVAEILEKDIGRIHDSGRFLGRGAAAQRDVAGADGGVAADVVDGLDQDYRRAVLLGNNGGGQPGSAGSDHHNVGFMIPLAPSLGGLGSGRHTGQRRALQECSTINVLLRH